MTREEQTNLRNAILRALPASTRTIAQADAVIRLVVEACCDIAETWVPEGVYAAEEMRSTFLPKDPSNGN